jgi:hypothetical protein
MHKLFLFCLIMMVISLAFKSLFFLFPVFLGISTVIELNREV